MATLKLDQLTKRYGSVQAVSGLTLEVNDGEFVVLLGKPGAGKSTTLKMIAGVEEPSFGSVSIGDRVVNDLPPEKRNVTLAFESYALYPHWTVRQNIEFPLRAPGRGLSPTDRNARITRVAQLLEIEHLLDRKPSQLSGGQRQRVSLGRALARSGIADITLLDEPIAHLDARLRHALRGELKRFQREGSATTLYSTPDYIEASAIADRVAVLIDGRLHQYASPVDLYDRPADLQVASMVGDPKINIFPLKDGKPVISLDGTTVPLPAVPGGTGYIGIRPAHFQLSPSEAPGSLPGKVYVTEPMGYDQVIRVEAGEFLVNVKVPLVGNAYSIGQPVWLTPNWQATYLFDTSGQRMNGGYR